METPNNMEKRPVGLGNLNQNLVQYDLPQLEINSIALTNELQIINEEP